MKHGYFRVSTPEQLLPCEIGAPVWSSVFCEIDTKNGFKEIPTEWPFSMAMMPEWGKEWHKTREEAEAAIAKEDAE